jgi:signal transduction histidine kinase
VETALYRIAMEALNNTLKHARASEVTVRLWLEPDRVSLEVEDNGIGFEFDGASPAGGLGLISMQERAEQVRANLEIETAPGDGCTVRVQVNRRTDLKTEETPL